MTHPRITIHDLGAIERELLAGLFAQAGADASDASFTIAALACAAARGIRSNHALGLTAMGLVVALPLSQPVSPATAAQETTR